MRASIRELRESMKRILDRVRNGEEVIVFSHKEPIARIVKISSKNHSFETIGFGMWGDYQDTQDVAAFARKLRKGRKHA